jgi:hypothetical protein
MWLPIAKSSPWNTIGELGAIGEAGASELKKQTQKEKTHVSSEYRRETAEADAPPQFAFESSLMREEETGLPSRFNPHQVAARGFAQTFGLQPAMAFLTVAVDLMLHAADVVSAGLLIPFSAAAGVALAIIAFLAQRKWFSDDQESALIKSLIIGLLTAIPSPLPYLLFVPAGIVGFFRKR